jgi:hypothetical protein
MFWAEDLFLWSGIVVVLMGSSGSLDTDRLTAGRLAFSSILYYVHTTSTNRIYAPVLDYDID